MEAKKKWEFFARIEGNASWDGVKWAIRKGWGILMPIMYPIYEKMHDAPIDWYLFSILAAIAFLYVMIPVAIHFQAGLPSKNSNEQTERNIENSSMLLFTSLQREILQLERDLKQLLKDAGPAPELKSKNPGPMPKGANVEMWMEERSIESNAWMGAYSEWARKIIYKYNQGFSERVKNVMNSLGATTGMVVVLLEPYTRDIRPGDDFQNLLDILLDFFVKLEGGRGLPLVKTHEVASANLPDFLDLKPYPLELILSEHSANPASVNFVSYRDRLVFKLQNKWDTEIDVCKPFWQSQEVPAQVPLYVRFYNVGDKDVSDNGRGEEKGIDVVHLPPNGIVSGWLGLLQPTRGDGLAVRARERNTGTLIFPIKVAGKMRFAWVKV